MTLLFPLLAHVGDACAGLRLYGLGAWCYGRALSLVEVEPGVRTITGPPCAPVFEQLLLARLRSPR